MIINLFPCKKVNVIQEGIGEWNVTYSPPSYSSPFYRYQVLFTPHPFYVNSSIWNITCSPNTYSRVTEDANTNYCSIEFVWGGSHPSEIEFTATRSDGVYSDTYTYS